MIYIGLLPIQQFTHYSLQTLSTLKLGCNEICDEGAKHLANALLQNKVT